MKSSYSSAFVANKLKLQKLGVIVMPSPKEVFSDYRSHGLFDAAFEAKKGKILIKHIDLIELVDKDMAESILQEQPKLYQALESIKYNPAYDITLKTAKGDLSIEKVAEQKAERAANAFLKVAFEQLDECGQNLYLLAHPEFKALLPKAHEKLIKRTKEIGDHLIEEFANRCPADPMKSFDLQTQAMSTIRKERKHHGEWTVKVATAEALNASGLNERETAF